MKALRIAAQALALLAVGIGLGLWLGTPPTRMATQAPTAALGATSVAPCPSPPAPSVPAPRTAATAANDTNIEAALQAYRAAWERGNLIAFHAQRAFGLAFEQAQAIDNPEQRTAAFGLLTNLLATLAALNNDAQALAEINALALTARTEPNPVAWQQLIERIERAPIAQLTEWKRDLPTPDALAYSFNPNQTPAQAPSAAPLDLLRAAEGINRTRATTHP